jgi:peptide/nickel transport system ATP-binding protein/oligopeptide transport system ATP-binding protein
MRNEEILLQVKNLKKYFPIKKGILKRADNHVKAVDDISFDVYKGETLGIVGESGSGKSTLGRTIIRLLHPTDGKVILEGKDITNLSGQKLKAVRKDMQMIFQDPFSSLNPRMTVEKIVEEPLAVQSSLSKKQRKRRVIDLLEKVGLSEDALDKYPHEFSGGQRQRIGIARALSMNPKFIIGDEPVSALDVSVQAQVLNLMKDLQEEFNLTYLFIAHDLSVVKHISDRVGVMYLGKMAEIGPKDAIYKNPLHPYTQALLSAVPDTNIDVEKNRTKLKGEPPSPSNPPSGCVFHTRCPFAHDRCRMEKPELIEQEDGHAVACHLYTNDESEKPGMESAENVPDTSRVLS